MFLCALVSPGITHVWSVQRFFIRQPTNSMHMPTIQTSFFSNYLLLRARNLFVNYENSNYTSSVSTFSNWKCLLLVSALLDCPLCKWEGRTCWLPFVHFAHDKKPSGHFLGAILGSRIETLVSNKPPSLPAGCTNLMNTLFICWFLTK